MTSYSVTLRLPQNGQKVLCYGHKTICCKQDMDETADWHEVTFKMEICEWGLKKSLPIDPEESILDHTRVAESWDCGDEPLDGQVIGVSKWKHLGT